MCLASTLVRAQITRVSGTVSDEFGLNVPFEVDSFYKRCLMEGVDIVSFALSAEKAIESYEEKWGK